MTRRVRPTLIAAIVVGSLIALLIVLLATRPSGTRASESAEIEGRSAPPIDGELVLGEPFDITETDQWVVVNFFATWCVPCRVEHPELVAFDEEHRELGDGRVIS